LATPDYGIWNLGVSVELEGQKAKNMVGLTINNILDTAYYDHLSRLKYFGLLNIGPECGIEL
jgi:outer membrane receptor for Fe3+-dicitrate